jgi:beta-lactamase superfamily II metal-dependent hydrolase
MILQIFDVEHGAFALLTCDNNTRMLIDCGHNATTGWYPGSYLQQQGITFIEMLAVSNYDEDHVSGLQNLLQNVVIGNLLRNPSVSPQTIRQLKSADGMGQGIGTLTHFVENHFTGPTTVGPTTFQGLNCQYFYNKYPYFIDENNLSLVLYLECHGKGVMFPGDLESDGWRALMTRADFQAALANTKVLVASHHGRDNGWCDELRRYCSPYYVVISDKRLNAIARSLGAVRFGVLTGAF